MLPLPPFEFATAHAVLFGPGTRREVPARVRPWGQRVLLVTGRNSTRAAGIAEDLRAAGATCVTWSAAGEPTVEDARRATEAARGAGIQVVVAVGGGSAIDLGKAVAALAANAGDPLDYLEVIGRARPLAHPSLPLVAVPTTAGSGSEVTRNAVLADGAQGVKASLRSPFMLPALAVVDPELAIGLPPAVTAATGMDALTQVIEPYLSPRANPLTDGFCAEGITRVGRSLRRAVGDGHDLAARADMALASLMGGLALANAGLGAVHGFAAPIGGRFGAPHGAVCAALLPAAMRVNLDTLRARRPGSPTLARFAQVARWVTGDPAATADKGIAWLDALRGDLNIPRLASYGIGDAHAGALVAAASRASSMRGNCVALGDAELRRILELAM